MVYLDNAATSWPKPESVYLATDKAFRECCGNPGRSGHRLSLAAKKNIEEARLLVSKLFAITNPQLVSFTLNATDSLNIALKGVLTAGDHVITSSMEHNSVARPLEALKAIGVEYTKVHASPVYGVAIQDVKAAIKENTKLIVFSHVCNVTGTVNPVTEIGALCREHEILFLVDAAQSTGMLPIDVQKMNIDLLAFPGHKGLLGPQGTGGLYVREGISLVPLKQGGTGSLSEQLFQPPASPDRYESGTPNTPGIAGLAAAVKFILDEGIENIQEKETFLANKLIRGISDIQGSTIYGPPASSSRRGVVSVTFEGIDVAEAAIILDNEYDIAVRSGLHCAPDAHKTIGTLDKGGTLRIGIGYFNSEKDIDFCIHALRSICEESG